MPTRRIVLAGTAAFAATSAFGQSADRPNPMPDELRKALERDANAPVLGNPAGNITLTEFFDYNCQFCRVMIGTVQKLISSDPDLRVVYREWPVFGEGSEFAARASLASLRQEKYWQFHAGLMGMKDRAVEASVLRVARQVGLDMARLRTDMDRAETTDHIAQSNQLAEHMGLMGTPSFIAGDEGVFGRMSLQEMQDLVARARRTMGVT
ncbi:DsbA family protein [Paracoccus tegillarcae]|uniref:Fis family transcriptional regulator n=1 Tax=Paracoccus tegillarcae TaxID=1529068 RepID=A0A2K9F0E8_9RHOB|nr:DsbA family protein [Paracoccus tegillarcae]AUH33832.1 Fis family transcriptional regulator [Paracoccus tegillarcae]